MSKRSKKRKKIRKFLWKNAGTGYSYRELSEELNVPISTVKGVCRKLLKRQEVKRATKKEIHETVSDREIKQTVAFYFVPKKWVEEKKKKEAEEREKSNRESGEISKEGGTTPRED